MADDKGTARKAAAADAKDNEDTTIDDPVVKDGATVVTQHDVDVVNHAREVLKKEAEGIEGTDGPADNFSGDSSDSPADHIYSNDPFKKAFPPGPDDPTKV